MAKNQLSMAKKSATIQYQDYYTNEDYDQIMSQLPNIIKEAERRADEILEPTIHEKRAVMKVIKDFLRKKGRKVYGGTAINELILAKNPADAIYDEHKFSDLEFYSPTPVPDLIELCNELYYKQYKYVQGREAQHEETYTIFVNFQGYCDISYVPTRVYHGIKTIVIDDIHYVHPHFILIDQLRIFNNPIVVAAQRWEKTFPRVYKLLKNYPIDYINKMLRIQRPTADRAAIFDRIKNEFLLSDEKIRDSCLISGFEAYNFFVKHAARDRNVEQMARTTYGKTNVAELLCNVPFVELISVDYVGTVTNLYAYLKKIVQIKTDLTVAEYVPLFQFTSHSIMFSYQGEPLVRVFEQDGKCIPNIRTTRGYIYVSYQYLLMVMLINKFRAHLDNNKDLYYSYAIAVSNLVKIRNIYLMENKLGVINKTVFGEFKIGCVGSTESAMRIGKMRQITRRKKGKTAVFTYTPSDFFALSEESQAKNLEKITTYSFNNTSGNMIANPRKMIFKLDDSGNLVKNVDFEEDEESETEISDTGSKSVATTKAVVSTDVTATEIGAN